SGFRIAGDRLQYIHHGISTGNHGAGTRVSVEIPNWITPVTHIVFCSFGPFDVDLRDAPGRISTLPYVQAVNVIKNLAASLSNRIRIDSQAVWSVIRMITVCVLHVWRLELPGMRQGQSPLNKIHFVRADEMYQLAV